MLATGGLLGGVGTAQVLAAGPAAAEPLPAVVVFDVRAYGADKDGATDDTAAFRYALTLARAVPGGGATLLVPPGSYALGESLLLGPGMTVQAHGARLFRTGNTSALVKNHTSGMPAVDAYEGAGNISVFGGTWDMRGSQSTSTCPAFVFTHADGFTVRDATVLDVPQAHAIELNAVRRARIVDCLFDGVYAGTGTPAVPNRPEAVQITAATSAANLPAPAFDGTPCVDVLITGCVMRNSLPTTAPYDALCGDHYVAPAGAPASHRRPHRNIRVLGNRVESSGAYGVRATDWQQSVIADNTIDSAAITGNHLSDIHGDGIGVDTESTEALIAQNTVLGASRNGIAVGSSEAAVRDNRITGAGKGGSAGSYAVRIGGNALNVSVQGNVARVGEGGGAEAGVGVMAGSQGAWVTGNDLRNWSTAIRDQGTGTVATGNLS